MLHKIGRQVIFVDVIVFECSSVGGRAKFELILNKIKKCCEKIMLLGSYNWGDGERRRSWEAQCVNAGAVLACDSMICSKVPDAEAELTCRNPGKVLA